MAINPIKSNKRSKSCVFRNKWRNLYFENQNPIVLDLGCGRGDFILAMSEIYPAKNFIGIDNSESLIYQAAKLVNEESLLNSAFIHAEAADLEKYLGENELNEIWITFPYTEDESAVQEKILTHPDFIEIYRKILNPGGLLHLKTEDLHFLENSSNILNLSGCSLITKIYDIHNSGNINPLLNIKTLRESDYIKNGKSIHYFCYSIK